MQQVGERADFVRALLDHRLAVGEQLVRPAAVDALGVLEQPDGHAQRGELLAGGIVQLAGDAAALFVLDLAQLQPQLAQHLLRVLALGDALRGDDGSVGKGRDVDGENSLAIRLFRIVS